MKAIDRLFKLYTKLDKYCKDFDEELVKDKKIMHSKVTPRIAQNLRKEYETIRKLLKNNKIDHTIARIKSAGVLLKEVEFLSKGKITYPEAIKFYKSIYLDYFYNHYFCEKSYFKHYNIKKNPSMFENMIPVNLSIKQIIEIIDDIYTDFCKKYKIPYDHDIKKMKIKYDPSYAANTVDGVITLNPEFKKPNNWTFYILIHELGHGFHDMMIEKLCKKKEYIYHQDIDHFSTTADGFTIWFSNIVVNRVKDKEMRKMLKKCHRQYLKYTRYRARMEYLFFTGKSKQMKDLKKYEMLRMLCFPAYKAVYYPAYLVFRKIEDINVLRKVFALGFCPMTSVKKLLGL